MKRSKHILFTAALVAFMVLLGLSACKRHLSPKPRGYFRIDFPEKNYVTYDSTAPYIFDYPAYAKVLSDTSSNAEAHWVNVTFPSLNGQLHLSYKTINNNLYELLEDSRKLAYKHTIKADAIGERLFENPDNQVIGILYDIKGNAASPLQFFATDSTRHFLRGSLYFNAVPNKDSLAPVIDFVHEDVVQLIESIHWKN